MWNGTAATLNASPTTVSRVPATATCRAATPPASAESIVARNTDPVAPYTRETPISITAVETTETRKNFTAASAARRSPRRSPAIANAGSETTSRATTSVTRSREAAITSAPVAEQSSRKFHSPSGVRPSATDDGADQRDHRGAEQRDAPEHQREPVDHERARHRPLERADHAERARGSGPTAGPRGHRRRTTASTVRVAGTSAARRLRGGPAKASMSSTTIAPIARTSGARDRRPVDVLGPSQPPEERLRGLADRPEHQARGHAEHQR